MLSLHADPLNPAEFFGACGVFELVAHTLPGARGSWARDGQRFVIESEPLDDVAAVLRDALVTLTLAAAPVPAPGADKLAPVMLQWGSAPSHSLLIDWWSDLPGVGVRGWKCFAGQQSGREALQEMLSLAERSFALESLPAVLQRSLPLTGRFGFDPRSAWEATAAGFSPNDHSQLNAARTYPWAELLTAIAAQTFPIDWSRRRYASYCVWFDPLPLALARCAAARGIGGALHCEFERKSRGKSYGYFRRAAPVHL
jgi:hypothetical protein